MLARFRETRAAQENRADPEFTIKEMTEWNSGGHHVGAGIPSLDANSRLVSCRVDPATEERFESLYLNECDLVAPNDRLRRKKPCSREIPISFEAAPRNGPHFRNRLHQRGSLRRDMNGEHLALPRAHIFSPTEEESPRLPLAQPSFGSRTACGLLD